MTDNPAPTVLPRNSSRSCERFTSSKTFPTTICAGSFPNVRNAAPSPGDIIVREGEAPDFMMVMLEGEMRARSSTEAPTARFLQYKPAKSPACFLSLA